MAGTLTLDTLKAGSGVLATQNGMTGIAKAWVNFNGTNGTIRGSFNVTSVTQSATGKYVVNFTTAMTNTNYCGTGTVGGPDSRDASTVRVPDDGFSLATGSCAIGVARPAVAYINADTVNVAFYGA